MSEFSEIWEWEIVRDWQERKFRDAERTRRYARLQQEMNEAAIRRSQR